MYTVGVLAVTVVVKAAPDKADVAIKYVVSRSRQSTSKACREITATGSPY